MLASLTASRTWMLNIYVTDLNVSKSVEVNGQTHLGQVILDLVEKLDVATDWSDHAMWHPERCLWLLKPRVTLETYGILGDCTLNFTPVHKVLKLQMPDLQVVDMRVNFSIGVFHAVKEICTDFGIRHPEEMSLLKPSDFTPRKKDKGKSTRRKERRGSMESSDTNLSSGSIENGRLSAERQISTSSTGNHAPSSPGSPRSVVSFKSSDFSFSEGDLNPYSTALSPMLANSPNVPNHDALEYMTRPRTIQERSSVNSGWLDSSKSLMEQDIKEFDYLMFNFKFFNFFDINQKVDEVRINQIYEQAKWQILTEEVECTEEEAITFAALQFQVKAASQSPQSTQSADEVDDIEAALNDLQISLEGTTANDHGPNKPSLTQIPEMSDTLNLIKSKKLGMKSVKSYWFTFRDTHVMYHKSKEDSRGPPVMKFNLKDCEIVPQVNVSKNKFHIKLKIPGPDMTEIELGCNSDVQYGKWMAACRLAAKGKTMADPTYDVEVAGIKTFISMQRDTKDETDSPAVDNASIQCEDFVPQRLLSRMKSKQIAARILEAHSGFTKLTLLEAKMNYIRQWKALPEFGITTLNVRFKNMRAKRAEILGVTPSRLLRMDPSTREILKEWRYSAMQSWNVNWETKEMIIHCEDEMVVFSCCGFDVKVIHEFIGGYIFLSMRKDVNSPPEEELFFKLTGGWV